MIGREPENERERRAEDRAREDLVKQGGEQLSVEILEQLKQISEGIDRVANRYDRLSEQFQDGVDRTESKIEQMVAKLNKRRAEEQARRVRMFRSYR